MFSNALQDDLNAVAEDAVAVDGEEENRATTRKKERQKERKRCLKME